MLVAQIGYKETEKRTGISANTLYQWARRFAWKAPIPHVQETVRTVRTPADTLTEVLSEHERKTKLGLASYASREAQRAASKGQLRDAGQIHNVAKTAAIVHRWDAKTENTQNIVVNVALLGVQPAEVSATVLDVDSEGQDSGE